MATSMIRLSWATGDRVCLPRNKKMVGLYDRDVSCIDNFLHRGCASHLSPLDFIGNLNYIQTWVFLNWLNWKIVFSLFLLLWIFLKSLFAYIYKLSLGEIEFSLHKIVLSFHNISAQVCSKGSVGCFIIINHLESFNKTGYYVNYIPRQEGLF